MTRSTALLVGSIGVLTECSDLQRRAFNIAFEEHGLDWSWSDDEYRSLLEVPGGSARIAHVARERGADVDVDAVYAAKVAAFERLVDREGLTLRPGIADLLAEARLNEMRLGFVTGTSTRQIALIAGALRDEVSMDVFDIVTNGDMVSRGKPHPDIYLHALKEMDIPANRAIAVEDTPESAQSALDAGITTFVYAGRNAAHRPAPHGAFKIGSPVEALRERSRAA
ncbi:HAD family hydrolase [Pseudaestuariivita atlantica]|uniref:Haloacid dehalogenase n=1 Tax=Pseudaestuariivita atlantica TaxID=1317121 RepID=A0A0L1JR70_9RHOB|nr:HAD-IA family hydrolase [Pseudaestuariivita atlantica]KNG93893.1 hypothetical protein ATO11_10375 [Pseudaestuariivita atlantica]